MSFDKFNFVYTPPPTVATPGMAAPPPGLTSTAQGSSAPLSKAADITAKLADLITTSQYLQAAILSQVGSAAVEIDPTVDPDTARALSAIYATATPPPYVTFNMFSNLLDAEVGSMQVDSALGLDSPYQQNPNQVADIATATRAVDQAMLQNPTYLNTLPSLLRPLKGDAYVFQSWQQSAAQYPAVRTAAADVTPQPGTILQAASIDMSDDVYQNLNDVVSKTGQAYAGIYGLLSSASAVENDINNVINTFANQPLADIAQISGLLSSVRGLSHLPTLEDLSDDLVNFAFARLGADLGGMTMLMDRMTQMAAAPLKSSLGTVARTAAGIQQLASSIGRLTTGGLKGMVQNNSCSKSPLRKTNVKSQQAYDSLTVPGVNSLTEGVKSAAAHVDWAQHEVKKKSDDVTTQLQRVNSRRLNHQADSQEVMCSLRTMDNLAAITKAFLPPPSQSKSTPPKVSSAASPSSTQISSILSNLAGVTKTTFVASNNQILVTPPAVPNPPDPVVRVLAGAGLRELSLT